MAGFEFRRADVNAPMTDQNNGTRAMIYLSVSMPVASGPFPNSEELRKRNAMIEELKQRQLGQSAGAGGGFGEMDFAFNVQEEATARALIAEVEQTFARSDFQDHAN